MKAIVKNWKTGIAKGIIVDVSEYPTDGVSNVYNPAEEALYTHTISLHGQYHGTWNAEGFAENFEIV